MSSKISSRFKQQSSQLNFLNVEDPSDLLSWIFTESQNCYSRKGSLELTQSNSLPRLHHPEPVTQEHIQMGFECLQGGRLHDLSGQRFQCSDTFNIKFFLMLKLNFQCLMLWPLLLILPLSTWKKSGTTTSAPAFEIFKCMDEVTYELSLLQTEQTQLLQTLLIKEIPKIPLALLATGTQNKLMANLPPTKSPRFFSAVFIKCGKLIISNHSMSEF